jgi:hypothetical protein
MCGTLAAMRIRTSPLATALFLVLVAACQQPADTALPGGSVAPAPGGASPVAPAMEPEPTGPDPTIAPPSSVAPDAPAIEPEPTGPDPTISFDPG